jgi:hypothetical protein
MHNPRTWHLARFALRDAVLTILKPIMVENKKANRGRQVAMAAIGVDRSHEI